MSTRTYRTRTQDGTPVQVTAGRDPQLGRLYLLVCRLEVETPLALKNRAEDSEERARDVETIFSNLDLDLPGMTLWEITGALHSLGLSYPPGWLQAVVRDWAGQREKSADTDHGFHPMMDPNHPLRDQQPMDD